ncbi:unnamed protein product [Cylindrotheca closterium]|uniref:Uncharacterized protein n=1 Tax=Cylindrotheca closterium TaxID=2856 RepID=A0AAD2CKV9_9STRA|nr:unnamed protein product [Cylindrotheca closterium]
MATLGTHPALFSASPSFDEDDYSQSTDYSYSTTSIRSSMTGSFRDDSVGDSGIDSPTRKPLTPFQNSFSTLAGLASSNNKKSSMPFGMQSPGTKAKKKADIDRAKRTIERLNQAEMQLKMKVCYTDNNDGRSSLSSKKGKKKKGKQENSEIKLKLSQIDIARNFYQRRINQNSVAGPVPLEILNIVKSVSAPPQQPISSRGVV